MTQPVVTIDNTFEEWRVKTNLISSNVGDPELIDLSGVGILVPQSSVVEAIISLANVIITSDSIDTLINKTIDLANNSLTGTKAQFNAALTDGDFATTDGIETLTGKTIVAANNTITTAPSGNLTSTELNAALAELQGDIDTRLTVSAAASTYQPLDADLTALAGIATTGIIKRTGAGLAVTIAAPTGDVVGTSDTQTLTGKTIVAANNTITTAPSGNLLATELNAALAELEGEISALEGGLSANYQPLDADLTALAGIATTGIIKRTGAGTATTVTAPTGDVVGTSDTQTLTGKTIVAANNTITTASSGNLTSTELNAALAELQGDIDTRLLASEKGAANGVVPLGADSKIASTYLPSYVDDVIESTNFASLPVTGETSKLYITLDTNKQYRWSGSAYVEINPSPGSTDAVPEGSVNLYFTAARVRDTVLTGLSTATNAVITAADTVLSALGKLQKQISDNLTTLTSHTGNTSNPHSVTKAQVGLSDAENKTFAVGVKDAIVAAVDKATPVDADSVGIVDSAAGNVLKELTFANLWTWVKSKIEITALNIINTAAGTSSNPFSITNSSITANTEVIFDLNPSTNAPGVRSAQVSAVNNGSNQITIKFKTSNGAVPTTVANLDFNGDFYPENNAVQDLGTASKKWDNIYGTTGIFTAVTLNGSDLSTILAGKQATITGAATTIDTENLTINRALISDASGKVAISAVTSTELGYVSGVTSAIQTQLNGKQATITGAASTVVSSDLAVSRALVANVNGKIDVSAVTSTELSYVSGVTSAIQTQLNGKQATITGGATTITSSNLTASRALISDASGKVAVSVVTSTEIGYLDGVTSSIQTQLNAKVDNDVGAEGVGMFCIGKKATVGTIAVGGTVAGSDFDMAYWDPTITSALSGVGTWKNVGVASATGVIFSVFQRIS